MSAEFMVRLKSLERRQLALEEDNKWLKDALAKVLAQKEPKHCKNCGKDTCACCSSDEHCDNLRCPSKKAA